VEDHRYRPDIDGLRAIAVGLVVLDHAGLMFSGGFIGVDVFFVISGFLITRLILSDHVAGIMTLKGFWMRRIRRILPAAAATVGVTLLVGTIILPPDVLTRLAESAIAQQMGLANIYFWQNCGYFDLPSRLQPLLHTWSLAVEEQFYLIWPLILMLLCRRSRMTIALTVSTLLLASLALSEIVTRTHPSAAFYLMPTRMWELLLGACLLGCPPRLENALQHSASVGFMGLLLILLTASTYAPTTTFPGLSAVPPCLGAALIIASPVMRRFSASTFLSMPVLVYIGRASYSVYLWHWPILIFSRLVVGEELSFAARACVAVAALTIGSLSFEFIETPFRTRRWASNNKRFIAYAGLAAVFLCTASFSVACFLRSNYPDEFTSGFQIPEYPLRVCPSWWSARPESDHPGFCGDPTALGPDPAFVIWGDSHAGVIAPFCDSLARSRKLRGVCLVRSAMVPLVGAWCNLPTLSVKDAQLHWGEEVADWIEENKVRDVIIVARWDCKVPPPSVQVGPGYVGLIRDRTSGISQAEARVVWEQTFRRTVSRLQSCGTRVWFLMQVPVQKKDVFGRLIGPLGISKQDYHNQQLEVERVLRSCSSPMLKVIGPGSNWFDRDEYSVIADNGGSFYLDDNHLNGHGILKLIQPLLEPVFDKMARDAASSPAGGSLSRSASSSR
jgi:peptidoglycan/LPS O-acetylase OafA/YrhL